LLVFSPSPEDDEDKSRETESFKGTEESEESQRSELLYGVDDSPSYILSVVLAFQVSFFCLARQGCILLWSDYVPANIRGRCSLFSYVHE